MSSVERRRRRATRPDPLTPQQRRHNMARIGPRDTEPEMLLRRALHRAGFRYRLHLRSLPGTPDLVMASPKAALFVHGCFWHAHSCPMGVSPRTNEAFCTEKLSRNVQRDARDTAELQRLGWRVAIVWECALKGKARRPADEVVARLRRWLDADEPGLEISGYWIAPGEHPPA